MCPRIIYQIQSFSIPSPLQNGIDSWWSAYEKNTGLPPSKLTAI